MANIDIDKIRHEFFAWESEELNRIRAVMNSIIRELRVTFLSAHEPAELLNSLKRVRDLELSLRGCAPITRTLVEQLEHELKGKVG